MQGTPPMYSVEFIYVSFEYLLVGICTKFLFLQLGRNGFQLSCKYKFMPNIVLVIVVIIKTPEWAPQCNLYTIGTNLIGTHSRMIIILSFVCVCSNLTIQVVFLTYGIYQRWTL